MTAFGPYKNTEVVDFTELKEHNLFVISGNTGAGKTTIFDGISFALYGSASGQDRGEVRLLRSDFADDDVHTAVELEFSLKNRHYRIRRQLGHIKKGNKSKTGEQYEFFEKKGDEEISCVDRQIVSEINEKLEELIGLTQDQFKQIVMLPQGEFRKLLTSETENKEEILRRLFKTESYKQINEVLKNKRSDADFNHKQLLQSREQYITSISSLLPMREESKMTEVVEAEYFNVNQVLAGLDEEAGYYDKKIATDEKNYTDAYAEHNLRQQAYHQAQTINEQFIELSEKEAGLDQLKERSNEYKNKERQLIAAERANSIFMYERQRDIAMKDEETKNLQVAEAGKTKQSVTEKLKQAQANFTMEEDKKPEREEAVKRLERLQDILPKVQEIESKKQDLQNLLEKGVKTKNELEVLESKIAAQEKQLQQYKQEISELDKTIDQFTEKPTQLVKLEEQAKAYQRYIKLAKDLKVFEQARNEKAKEYNQIKEIHEEKEASWLSNQAVVLANHLHDGKACPVCGSLEHPVKATGSEQDVTKEQLTLVKRELDEKDKAFRDASIKLEAKQAHYQDTAAEVKAYTENLADVETLFDELIVEGKQMRTDVATFNSARAELKKIKLAEVEVAKVKAELEPIYAEKKEMHQALQQEYKTAQAIYKDRLRDVPDELKELAVLEQLIEAARNQKLKLETAWENVQKHLQTMKEEYTKAEANHTHLAKQLEEVQGKRIEASKEFEVALEKQQFLNEEAYLQAKISVEEQQQLKEDITTFNQQLTLLTQQTEELQKKLKDKLKIDLSALAEEVNQLKTRYEDALKQLNQSKENLKDANELKEKIKVADEKVRESEQLLSLITDIHDTLRGQNSKKISFERFLQIEYLEQIIHAANHRLQHLSNNQYYLTRSNRQESHGKQSGLALDVFDSHTGQTRDVKSLSGGEKFHAALSLALGMSDVIQSFQGNISIDTMFIDEGFGSLDEEALTKAVDALIELMESGRMIGVISHVKELKEIFPAILEVKKTREGHSKTEFVLK